MTLDLDRYRVHFKDLKMSLEPRDESVRYYWAAYYAATANCPIIAVYHYVAEIYGMNAEIERRLVGLMEMNSVTKVIGQRT